MEAAKAALRQSRAEKFQLERRVGELEAALARAHHRPLGAGVPDIPPLLSPDIQAYRHLVSKLYLSEKKLGRAQDLLR